MPRHSYRERDYTFGQLMLKLRTSMGLTQAGLTALLGVTRRAIGEWEGLLNYPKAHHLQHFLGDLLINHWISRTFETSCAVGTPLPMRLYMASEYTGMPLGTDHLLPVPINTKLTDNDPLLGVGLPLHIETPRTNHFDP